MTVEVAFWGTRITLAGNQTLQLTCEPLIHLFLLLDSFFNPLRRSGRFLQQ